MVGLDWTNSPINDIRPSVNLVDWAIMRVNEHEGPKGGVIMRFNESWGPKVG